MNATRILGAGATWRLAGIAAAGDALVTAATTGDETERTLAGMQLVKAGDRSVPIVADAVLSGDGTADLVDVLASIGTPDARAALVRAAQTASSTVALRAADALRTLDQIRGRREDGS